jgi:hypothetical protein
MDMTGMMNNKTTHQGEMYCSWWVYCKISKNQNAEINEIDTYCSLAQKIFSDIWMAATSNPINKDQAAMEIIMKEKYMIPGVFHHRQLINAIVIAMVAVSMEINTSDVNCQVKVCPLIIDDKILPYKRT